MQLTRFFATALVACTLAGCASGPTLLQSTAKQRDYLITDSKLRVISTSDQGIFSTTGVVEPQRITCTEPSPDVATTIANSFGGGLSLFGRGSASLSAQQVEGLVQLGERTAAIQLLRDKMYQTCLAYSNGAITGTMYSLIMSRLDDAIVTLSFGDNVAGAFGRRLAALGGEASSSSEAAVTGLPGEIAKIEEQAGKLAGANKKVDDAAKALEAHKATQPAEGKEDEYKQQTKDLETALATAKAERNALLELMRATATNAAKASGKISEVRPGGSITASPNAQALKEMHGEYMLADSNRDLVFACMVELGLRSVGSDAQFDKLTEHMENLFKANPNATSGAVYAGAILRSRSTALAKLCVDQLPTLLTDAAEKAHTYRKLRATLSAKTATARYSGETAKANVRDRELFLESIKTCNTEFKEDADRRKACLDKVIPIAEKGAGTKPKAKPAAKSPAKPAA